MAVGQGPRNNSSHLLYTHAQPTSSQLGWLHGPLIIITATRAQSTDGPRPVSREKGHARETVHEWLDGLDEYYLRSLA